MAEEGAREDKPVRTGTCSCPGHDDGRLGAQPVPEESLDHVLELARLSPIDCCFRPLRWIVVRHEAAKKELESSVLLEAPLTSAPVILICLADTGAWKSAPQQLQGMVAKGGISPEEAREILRRIRDCYSASPEVAQRAALADAYAALHHIRAAAASCRLATFCISVFNEQRIKTYFHIPDQFLVAALVAIGCATKPISPPPELPLQSLVYSEKFGDPYAPNR